MDKKINQQNPYNLEFKNKGTPKSNSLRGQVQPFWPQSLQIPHCIYARQHNDVALS